MMFDSSANSIRHAATVSLRRRHNRGLSYTVNYTFGKDWTTLDAGDVRFVNLNVRSTGHVNYGASRSLDRSVSLFDIKHAFSASWVWDLPVGRGRQFLARAPGLIDSVIGGWGFSGIGRIQGGIPMVAVLRDDNRLGVEGKHAQHPSRSGTGRAADQSQLGSQLSDRRTASLISILRPSCAGQRHARQRAARLRQRAQPGAAYLRHGAQEGFRPRP